MARCPSCKTGVLTRADDKNTANRRSYHCGLCGWDATYELDTKERKWVEVKSEAGETPEALPAEAPVATAVAQATLTPPAAEKTQKVEVVEQVEQNTGVRFTEVRLTLKLSRQLKDGVWKGVEVGASADVNGSGLEAAQSELYEAVNSELERVWEQAVSPATEERIDQAYAAAAQAPARRQPAPAAAAAPELDPLDPSYCPIHRVQMKQWVKDGRVWYSHKAEDGAWCKGK